MKKLYFLCLTLLITSLSFGQDLVITGIIDGPLPGGFPKGIELYVVNDIADLSVYGLERAGNGGASTGTQSYTFPADSYTAGDFIYISPETPSFNQYLGINPTYEVTGGELNNNGDDVVLLYANGSVSDAIGVAGVDGTGEPWEYLDGWAYRVDGFGPNATFDVAEWTFSGPNALDGCDLADDSGTNAGCASVFPLGTYSPMVNTNPTVTITSPTDFEVLPSGTTTVDVVFTIANAPGATVDITVIKNGGTPAVTNNATSPFQIVGAADGDTYEVTAELVDGSVLDFETIDFSIAYPCDLQVGTITETCDAINPGPGDTYNVTIDYTGGGTSTYTIDTGGVGTVAGDNPNSVAAGTITIVGVAEGTDFIVTFTGDAANSSCDFTRNVNSPNCDPQLVLPITENFDYADGSLVGNSDWASHGGNAGDLLVVSGQAVVQHGTPSEDANLPFTSVSGDLYYAFDMIVPDLGAPYSGTDFEYFAHFKNDAFGFKAQLDIVVPTGAGDYTLGISSDANTADATWATDLLYDTTYRVTVRYNQDTNIAELWVDATSESDPSILGADEADPGDTVASFAFRQSDSAQNESILVDNLRIAQTFDQTTLSNEEFAVNNFKVYPNPTSTGFVNIISNNSDAISVAVYDILGKQVINTALNNDRLDVSALNAGVYILKISQNNASVTKKLVIK
ncbi:T9SS type A sorting domain-containing protein [Psychroserpens luteolus]|uniref:T9SS type A sorting domain-containing protein n=1 Tax=Psychroserpens luteolus TaxID=2855840 RepID=UPI001E411FF1|nr:T9SS type A sorting domain-containing protein [Psychroserpens luteolus]MCD2257888.1 T9SS type A sorting domain-containing protein [Psychroserpens luteolus]